MGREETGCRKQDERSVILFLWFSFQAVTVNLFYLSLCKSLCRIKAFTSSEGSCSLDGPLTPVTPSSSSHLPLEHQAALGTSLLQVLQARSSQNASGAWGQSVPLLSLAAPLCRGDNKPGDVGAPVPGLPCSTVSDVLSGGWGSCRSDVGWHNDLHHQGSPGAPHACGETAQDPPSPPRELQCGRGEVLGSAKGSSVPSQGAGPGGCSGPGTCTGVTELGWGCERRRHTAM